MKENNRIHKLRGLVFLLAFILMATAGAGTPVMAADSKNKDVVLTDGKGLSVTVEYGFSHYAKYGRNMPVRALVENQGDDFSGEFQILVPRQNQENSMFGREISVAAGESKTIELPLFLDFSSNVIYARVMRGDKEIAGSKLFLSVKGATAVAFTGLLSDQPEELSYLNDKKSLQTFDLTAKTFPEEEKMLDSLDVIVMDNFDSSKLSKEQYETLKAWIQHGGSLVIGTGSNVKKVFQLFQDDFLTGSVGEGEENQAVITLDEAAFANDKVIPYQVVSKGEGNVMVYDQAIAQYGTKENSAVMISQIYNGMSKAKKTQLQKEEYQDNNYYNYSVMSCISAVSRNLLPKVSDYALVLIIYCIVAGPVLYVIFKKLDKRNYLWLAIPVGALVFSGVIYLIGGKTRVTKPFANYLTISTLSGNENITSNDTTYFGVLAAKDQKYEFRVASDRNLTMLSDTDGYYDERYESKNDFSKYKTGMTTGADFSKLILNHKDVFSWAAFKDQSISEEKGQFGYDLVCDGFKTKGSITNQLGYNLENVAVYAGNTLYFVGDVADGGTVQLPSKKTQHIYNYDSLFSSGDVYETMAGGAYYNMRSDDERYEDAYKKYNAINAYFGSDQSWIYNGDFLFGFAKDAELEKNSGTIISELGIESHGLRMVIIPLEIPHTYGKLTMEDSIEPYLTDSLEELGITNSVYRSMSQNVTLTYQFDTNNLPEKLAYLEGLNPEISKNSGNCYTCFAGKIYAVDESGNHTVLFESGKEKVVDIKKYINDDGTLCLYFERDESKINNLDIVLPVLSVLREAK